MDLHGKRIILGSNSPRRRELLKGMDVEFVVDAETSFVEHPDPDMPHRLVPAMMAEGKSKGFHRPLADDEILITSDTMVLCGERMMGKPHSPEEAAQMLRTLSGRDHVVVTAVCIRNDKRHVTMSDATTVWFKKLSDSDIAYYLSDYKPYDKAGAYGVQEWIGYVGIEKIEGSFYTVMGFPTHLVHDLILQFI